jgi:hypothetical protein
MIRLGNASDIIRFFNDDLGMINPPLGIRSWTYNGSFYDSDKYDLVPKQEYIEAAIKEKDEDLQKLETYYKNKKKEIEEEKSRLLSQKKALKSG